MVCFDYEVVKCSVCGVRTQDGYLKLDGKVVCNECIDAGKWQPAIVARDRETEVAARGVRALALIGYEGREYRLWELRPVDEPGAPIPLNTALAARIISEGMCITRARYLH